MNAVASINSERLIPRMRVLIADDVQETRRGTRLMLAHNPTVKIVAIAHNGLEAVELAKKHKPEIAIVDINMPEMNGIVAIREMRQHLPDLKCIVISVEREAYIYDDAMQAGALEYLVKPFTVDELNQAVEKAAEQVMTGRSRQEALIKQAQEVIDDRRSDEQAVRIFEQLASDPACELHWLVTLGIIYMLRGEWGKLRALAERLEMG
jgi:DNA-binding NarL/FixJ family response regulator